MKSGTFYYYLSIAILLGIIFWPSILQAQHFDPDRESGALFTRYYSPKEYDNFSQNWAALQDAHGVMIFANGNGVLQFDGVKWEFHSLPNQNVLRSLVMDERGRVYTGAYDELGYLDADSLGNYRYVSLNAYIKEEQLDFGNVHKTYGLKGSIIFQTDKGLYIWKNDHFRYVRWTDEKGYQMSFLDDGVLYVQQSHIGLGALKGETIELLKGGEFFKRHKIREVLSFDNDHKLVLTAQHGMYLYSEKNIIPFKTEIDDYLKENLIYCGIRLPDDNYAIGTLNGGAFIIDKKGKVRSIHNKSTGLGDNAIYNFYLDRQNALWVTLSNGIARIEAHSPITHFLENFGLDGSVNGITRFRGNLYAGSSQGLFRLVPAKLPDLPAHFEKVRELNSGVWGLANLDDVLILNTDLGTYVFDNSHFKKINDQSGNSLYHYKSDPNIIFDALIDGVGVLKKQSGGWESAGKVSGIKAETYDIEEMDDGRIWVSTFSEGIYLLQFTAKNGETDYLHPTVKNFGEKEGLIIGYTSIHRVGGQELFLVKRDGLPDQVYVFDQKDEKFVERNDFSKEIGLDSISSYPASGEENGRFWIQDLTHPNDKLIATRQSDSAFDFQRISFARVAGYSFRIIFEEGDIAWWGGHNGLVRVEKSKSKVVRENPFEVIIDKISLSNDSVLFTGTNKPLEHLEFPYHVNSIRFEYAATSYDNHEENRYQYFLDGFDDEWSNWTKEAFTSYTKIPEGSYIFKVRGKDIHDEISDVTSYAFTITPPWFRSWWMYVIYVGVIVLVVTGIFRWRLDRIKREKEKLEQIVNERTREVKKQSEQLEQQATKLLELDQAKSYFFANVSHEFRTPLTLILGIIDELLGKNAMAGEVDKLAIMKRNAHRLQTLINQLLDLSKLESKELKLNVGKGNINWYVKSIASGFASLATQRNIDYQIHIPDEKKEGFYDADKLEKIVTNLLSNAFKFTPEGGKVKISVAGRNEHVLVAVEDSGAGIPPDQIKRIFERFYQIDSSKTRLQEGAGIGLALTKELAELHKGRIEVNSETGQGSIFKIEIPISRRYYKEDEISQHLESEPVSDEIVTGKAAGKYEQQNVVVNSEERPILLIVEDNADLRLFISGHLPGYKIMEASNGVEGVKKAMKYIPDLVISDIMMPEMDGVELCKKLKEDEVTSHIPIVLLTAKADIESKLEGLDTGADDYITKPFHAKELQIRVRNLIEQRGRLRDRFSRSVVLKPKDVAITPKDEVFLHKIMAIVENQMDNSAFSIGDFQREIGMSRMQLHRKLRALTGQSATEFIRIQRLIRAGELLSKGGGNVSEVCYQTGFSNPAYFSRSFKSHFGVSPRDYFTSH